jgi:hypothetical protein
VAAAARARHERVAAITAARLAAAMRGRRERRPGLGDAALRQRSAERRVGAAPDAAARGRELEDLRRELYGLRHGCVVTTPDLAHTAERGFELVGQPDGLAVHGDSPAHYVLLEFKERSRGLPQTPLVHDVTQVMAYLRMFRGLVQEGVLVENYFDGTAVEAPGPRTYREVAVHYDEGRWEDLAAGLRGVAAELAAATPADVLAWAAACAPVAIPAPVSYAPPAALPPPCEALRAADLEQWAYRPGT